MNRKYEVIWSNVAEDDLNKTIHYIAQESVQNAFNTFNKIKNRCLNLHVLPNRGRIVPELKEYGILLYREIVIPPWRVIYRISNKYVFVLSVIDSRQNVEDILLGRFVGNL